MYSKYILNNNHIIKNIIFLNGIYDIICAVSILFLNDIYGFCYIAQIHPTIFNDYDNKHCRMMAYWIFTYGIIRLFIYQNNRIIDKLIAFTYFIEALAFTYEDVMYKSTYTYKVIWIFLCSIIIGLLLLFTN